MKYADSQTHTFTLTAEGTVYSPWYNVDFANELYGYATYTYALGVTGNESSTVSIQRYVPLAASEAASGTDVVAFTTRAVTTVVEEVYAVDKDEAAQGAENKLGMRVRFEAVQTGNAWTADQILTIVVVLNMKRN